MVLRDEYNWYIIHTKSDNNKCDNNKKNCRIINRTVNPSQVQKHTRLKICNTLALPALLYGYGSWAIRKHDKSRMTLAEAKFMRRKAKYTWQDCKTNEYIL